MAPPRIRIGAVSYLNTLPLIWGIEHGLGADRLALSYDVPSGLARSMTGGELEVGLLPVASLAELSAFEVVPGLAITTRGPSRSVLMLSRRPLDRIERVALDPESRTSNALVQVLLDRVWRQPAHCAPGPASLTEALRDHDAVVRIGDKALFESHPDGLHVFDLGTTWTEATGLPFVFAVWAALPGIVDRALYRLLHASRREGRRQLQRIVETFEWNGTTHPDLVRTYLEEHIHYRLGSAELKAMRMFLTAATELGLIRPVPEIPMALAKWTSCHETAAALRREAPETDHVPTRRR